MSPSRWFIFVSAAAACLFVLAASSRSACAQGTARSMDFETSIRAAGMGGASAGVWWGEPGVWGNASTLANMSGVAWLNGRTQLVPGLATDVRLNSQRLLAGGGGLGVSLMGAPFDGVGKLRLDYGTSQGTDPFGNPTGTFASFEQVEGWGIGLSPVRLFDAVRQLGRGGEPPVRRRFDVALGVQRKHTVVALAPIALSGTAAEDTWDYGASARVSLLPDQGPTAPVHLDFSGGFAVLNANDNSFVFINEDAASPASRIRRMGWAVHAALPSPWSGATASPLRILVAEVHALEVGVAFDAERVSAGGGDPHYNVQRFGVEAMAFGVLTGRFGHISDRTGQIVGNTLGYGLRLPLGPWAAVAYDHASVPQSGGLPDVQRKGWSVNVQPMRIWQSTHAER